MNVTIEIEKYLVVENGEIVNEWYSEECAEDYITECAPNAHIEAKYIEVVQRCDDRND